MVERESAAPGMAVGVGGEQVKLEHGQGRESGWAL